MLVVRRFQLADRNPANPERERWRIDVRSTIFSTIMRGRYWWALPAISFAALSAVNFSYMRDALFYRSDGTFHLTMVTSQKKWMSPEIGFSFNFLQGLGDIWAPTATQLMPGFRLASLVADVQWMPVIAMLVFALEFFFSTIVLARCLGAGRLTSLAAALIGALLTLPYFVPALAGQRIWGNPHSMEVIATTTLALCAFIAIGRTRTRTDAILVLTILVLLGHIAIVQPAGAPFVSVMLLVFGLAAVAAAKDNSERLWKSAAAAFVSLTLAAAFLAYGYALFSYARTAFFWDDLVEFPVDWTQQSFLILTGGPGAGAGPYLWGTSLAGAVLVGWRERGRLRIFAIAFLLFIVLQLSILLYAQIGGVKWSGPPLTIYVDLFCLPFYAIFSAYLFVGWWIDLPRPFRWAMPGLVLLPWASVFALHHPYSDSQFRRENPLPWPPRSTSLVELLKTEIGFEEGAVFRGRVVNLGGTGFEHHNFPLAFSRQYVYSEDISFRTGNDHRYYGMWYFDIPTLIESNPFSSPFFYAINSRLLNARTEKHVRAVTTVTRFEPRLFAMLGVRFVITDRPVPGLEPKSRFVADPADPEKWTLFLYEIRDAKTGGYWSTSPALVQTTDAAMRWMADPASLHDATVYEHVPPSLLAGSSSEIRVFRDRLVVEAKSEGTSLLILPVEFSHCFDVDIVGDKQAHFQRANVNQGAFLFTGQLKAELRYRFSPWHFRCRLDDIADAKRLQLSNVGWP
jgi:hypothetical protein